MSCLSVSQSSEVEIIVIWWLGHARTFDTVIDILLHALSLRWPARGTLEALPSFVFLPSGLYHYEPSLNRSALVNRTQVPERERC